MRPVDADALMAKLNRKKAGPANQRYTEGFNDCPMRVRSMVHSAPTLTPPNEALTIEELREMNGEPVWIVDVGPHKWYGPGWAIVDRDNCLVRTVKNWNAVFFESYGERWLAYRRPPEGEV